MFSGDSEVSCTQVDGQVLVQALQYHFKSITNICANFYSHEELSTVLVESCNYIASKLLPFSQESRIHEKKHFSIEDSPGVLHTLKLLVKRVENIRTYLEAIKVKQQVEHCNFFDRLKISEEIGQQLARCVENLRELPEHNTWPIFQVNMEEWILKEREARVLDQINLQKDLKNLLQLMNERRTDIRGVMKTLIPLTLRDLATKSQLMKAFVEGDKTIQSLRFARGLLSPDHLCYDLLVSILNRITSLCASGQAILEDTSVHPSLFESFPMKTNKLMVRLRAIVGSHGHQLGGHFTLRHYDTYADLIRAIIHKPLKNCKLLRHLMHIYVKQHDLDSTKAWKLLPRNKPYIGDIASEKLKNKRAANDDSIWQSRPIIIAFVRESLLYGELHGTAIEYIPDGDQAKPFPWSLWTVRSLRGWYSYNPPSFLDINERGLNREADSSGVLSRYLPSPTTRFENQEPSRNRIFFDHLPIPRLNATITEVLPSLTIQASSVKLMGFLIGISLMADTLEYMAICVDIATQQSLHLAAQARLLVASLNFWVQKRTLVEYRDFLEAKTLRHDFELVEELFNEITNVQDRLKLLTSWHNELKQRFETLYDCLFAERYYWSQMEVEKTYSRQIYRIIMAFDSWDIASQLNYFQQHDRSKSILRRLSLKVGIAKGANDEQRKNKEHYDYEYFV